MSCIFFIKIFFVFKKITWQYLKKIQITNFNKNAFVKVSKIFNPKNSSWSLVEFCLEILLMNFWKAVWNSFRFFLLRMNMMMVAMAHFFSNCSDLVCFHQQKLSICILNQVKRGHIQTNEKMTMQMFYL